MQHHVHLLLRLAQSKKWPVQPGLVGFARGLPSHVTPSRSLKATRVGLKLQAMQFVGMAYSLANSPSAAGVWQCGIVFKGD